jgi:hypothetical protein
LPGYDGGLQQSFGLEVYEKIDDKLVLNLTNSMVSSFELSALQSDTNYNIKVYAINVKGKSEPFLLFAKTNALPIPSTGLPKFVTIYEILWLMIGVFCFRAVIPQSNTESEGLIEKLVIIAVTLAIITILVILFCKILRKFRQTMSSEVDDEDNEDKSDEIIEYMDDVNERKNYQNGVLPQDYSQSHAMRPSSES